MVAGGGAMVAIMVAARQKQVIDAFRLGDATSADRAKRIEELGIAHYDEVNYFVAKGVLLPGRREGTYYLSEAGYIANRDGRKASGRTLAILSVVLILLGLALVVFVAAARE